MIKPLALVSFVAIALALSLSSADAAITNGFTVNKGVTEGNGQNRQRVADTADLKTDAAPGGAGIGLGQLDVGEIFGIYGRIVGSSDTFSFEFIATGSFEVRFDFDGYDLHAGGSVDDDASGLVIQPSRSGPPDPMSTVVKSVTFSLLKGNDGAWDEIASETFSTNYTVNTLGSDAFIFGANEVDFYRLVVDGSGAGTDNPNPNAAALYDLNIAAVPLPIGAVLLLTALGGAAAAYRTRKSV